ncbi:hypothetical protein, partial [Methylogaea oryzae]
HATSVATPPTVSTFSSTPLPFYTPPPATPLRAIQALEPAPVWPATSDRTPEKVAAATNQATVANALAQIVVVEQCRLSAALEYATQNDAAAVRDYLCRRLSSLGAVADDGVYHRFQELRAAVHADLSERGSNKQRVATIVPATTLPALVLAYRHHGDATRESDILSRNPRVSHPGFVPGGESLEVLAPPVAARAAHA